MSAQTSSLDQIRLAYIDKLRTVAAGHKSHDGMDLTRERVLTERIDREMKELMLAEKRGQLVNVSQLEPALVQMVVAFRTEMLTLVDRIKTDLDALHGIDIDITHLTSLTHDALDQLARYDPERACTGAPTGGEGQGPDQDDDDGVGAATASAQP